MTTFAGNAVLKGKYRWRTWLRGHSPWWLVNRGFAGKSKHDCGDHEWYLYEHFHIPANWIDELDSVDVNVYRCYHCQPGFKYEPAKVQTG